jgi:hypothetical protein
MVSEVVVKFGPGHEVYVTVRDAPPMSHEDGRHWLDDQYQAFDCDSLRASGKVLLADKVLAIARAAGHAQFGDESWAQDFARATTAALSRSFVTVDVAATLIGF